MDGIKRKYESNTNIKPKQVKLIIDDINEL